MSTKVSVISLKVKAADSSRRQRPLVTFQLRHDRRKPLSASLSVRMIGAKARLDEHQTLARQFARPVEVTSSWKL